MHLMLVILNLSMFKHKKQILITTKTPKMKQSFPGSRTYQWNEKQTQLGIKIATTVFHVISFDCRICAESEMCAKANQTLVKTRLGTSIQADAADAAAWSLIIVGASSHRH
uniref:(northern house mosquito) hypothetical protein n=1 Tax=Culex pipiens TaxID=7175 RepID=A0A8D8BQC1_CULPI